MIENLVKCFIGLNIRRLPITKIIHLIVTEICSTEHKIVIQNFSIICDCYKLWAMCDDQEVFAKCVPIDKFDLSHIIKFL